MSSSYRKQEDSILFAESIVLSPSKENGTWEQLNLQSNYHLIGWLGISHILLLSADVPGVKGNHIEQF